MTLRTAVSGGAALKRPRRRPHHDDETCPSTGLAASSGRPGKPEHPGTFRRSLATDSFVSFRNSTPQSRPSGTAKTAAQKRLAAQRAMAAATGARAARRRRLFAVLVPIAAVVLVVAVFVVVKVTTGAGTPKSGHAATSANAAVISKTTSVPPTALNKVGTGTVKTLPKPITGVPLSQAGKPRILYVGAEYCPYCAAERWPFVVAMSRFGTFSNLQATSSAAAPEVFPDTPTLSFHGATYTSQYLSFTAVETQTNTHQPLDTLTADDQKLFDTYNSGGGIPWIDYGGKAASGGASIDATLLAGKTQATIAAEIADPSTALSKAVLGSANVITARLCQLTGNQPAAVCSSSAVSAVAGSLGTGQ